MLVKSSGMPRVFGLCSLVFESAWNFGLQFVAGVLDIALKLVYLYNIGYLNRMDCTTAFSSSHVLQESWRRALIFTRELDSR